MPTSSRRRIALITDGLLDISQVYQRELRKAFEQAAGRDGFDVVIAMGRGLGHLDPGERAQNVVYDWITPQSVDGAVLLSGAILSSPGCGSLESLVARLGALPKVSIGVQLRGVPSVTVDNRSGIRDAFDHLIRLHGCQRIAYLAGPSDNQEAAARLEGYRYALRSHFMRFDPALVEAGPFTVDGGTSAMRSLLERGQKFDAVVAANDAIAVGALKALGERNLSVPERVRLIGFDDSPLASSALLSSVAQPFNQLARHALEALKDAMLGRSSRPIEFRPRLALRESCGCGRIASKTQLPELSAEQARANDPAAERAALAKALQQANGSSFNWWLTRVDRLLEGLDAALAGDRRQLMQTLDELTLEAFEDDVPLEQITRNLARLQRHFEASMDRGWNRAATADLWSDARARLTAAHQAVEEKLRDERSRRSVVLNEVIADLSRAEDATQLGRRLAAGLRELQVRWAYLGVRSDATGERFWPLLQLDTQGRLKLGGPQHECRQLLPAGFPGEQQASTSLVAAVTLGSDVSGVWVCEGGTDICVFEKLRAELSTALPRLASRQSLLPAGEAPLLLLSAAPAPPLDLSAFPEHAAQELGTAHSEAAPGA